MYLPSLYILFLLRFEAVVSVVTHRRYTIDALCPQKLSNMTSHNDTTMKTGESILLTDTPLMFSAIFEHSWDNTTDKYFPDCEFDVKALSVRNPQAARGMIIAIRELSFRSNRAGECIDYIVFRGDDAAMGNTNTKICGIANENESYYRLDNYIEIPDGRAKVIIHIEPYDSPWIKLSIKLTFTAVEDCTGLFRLHCKPNQCIAASLFDDKIANCKPPSCDDEPEFKTKCVKYAPSEATFVSLEEIYGTLLLLAAMGSSLSVVAFVYFYKIYQQIRVRVGPDPCRFLRRRARFPMRGYEMIYINPRAADTSTPLPSRREPVPPTNETAFNEP